MFGDPTGPNLLPGELLWFPGELYALLKLYKCLYFELFVLIIELYLASEDFHEPEFHEDMMKTVKKENINIGSCIPRSIGR